MDSLLKRSLLSPTTGEDSDALGDKKTSHPDGIWRRWRSSAAPLLALVLFVLLPGTLLSLSSRTSPLLLFCKQQLPSVNLLELKGASSTAGQDEVRAAAESGEDSSDSQMTPTKREEDIAARLARAFRDATNTTGTTKHQHSAIIKPTEKGQHGVVNIGRNRRGHHLHGDSSRNPPPFAAHLIVNVHGLGATANGEYYVRESEIMASNFPAATIMRLEYAAGDETSRLSMLEQSHRACYGLTMEATKILSMVEEEEKETRGGESRKKITSSSKTLSLHVDEDEQQNSERTMRNSPSATSTSVEKEDDDDSNASSPTPEESDQEDFQEDFVHSSIASPSSTTNDHEEDKGQDLLYLSSTTSSSISEATSSIEFKTKTTKPNSKGHLLAIDIIGHSQGGLVSRWMIQNCELPSGAFFRRFVSVGSPQSGVTRIPGSTAPGPFATKVWGFFLRTVTLSDFMRRHFAYLDYVYSPAATLGQRANSFIGRLNNFGCAVGIPTSKPMPTFKKADSHSFHGDIAAANLEMSEDCRRQKNRFAGLEKVMLILFEGDTVLSPKESAFFADVGVDEGKLYPLQETLLWQQDLVGLRALHEQGKLLFRRSPNEHDSLSPEEERKMVAEFLLS
ncbi:unnamed protein product [Amoebophrya sp. A25]|nr:unnamed protein product [Amoebophrya sp. A25]|eukprot:GSA25T00017199001.1